MSLGTGIGKWKSPQPAAAIERQAEQIEAFVGVAHVKQCLAVGRDLRHVGAVDHVRHLVKLSAGELVRVHVRDAGAIGCEVHEAIVG
jgi:hypothetical protein